MSARSGKGKIRNFSVKTSFFQDLFTIIEELTGDCPGVGLPERFNLNKSYYNSFHNLQSKKKLTGFFLKDFKKVKKLHEWPEIRQVMLLYKKYWLNNKNKLQKSVKQLKSKSDLNGFVKKLEKVTNTKWTTKHTDICLTLGYKNSGTYDRLAKLIRLGIHEKKPEFLQYTLFHELIHQHLVEHMKIHDAKNEEILCRAIFNVIFLNDKIAQKHWRFHLKPQEIKQILNKSKKFL